jgi:hypothetical protein
MFVDWAGDKLEVINGTTSQPRALEQFVAILGASELTYVEARESQQEEDWHRAYEGALWYWGGCPTAAIPDNCKTAVSRTDPYEPGLNPVFDDFAHHYWGPHHAMERRKAFIMPHIPSETGLSMGSIVMRASWRVALSHMPTQNCCILIPYRLNTSSFKVPKMG